MTPFIFETTLSIDGNGHANYPEEYLQTDSLRTSANDRIRFTQQDSLYSYLKSEIDPIASNPIFLLVDDGFQFYPKNLGTATLSYVMNAPTIVWAYTLDGNNRPVYSPVGVTGTGVYPTTGSVDPLWFDIDKLEIVARVLKLVGLNLQAGVVEQYANQVTQQGQ